MQNPEDSIIGQFEANQGGDYTTVAFALKGMSNSTNSADGGELHLFAPDPDAYRASLSFVKVVGVKASARPPTAASTDWAVPIGPWKVEVVGGQVNGSFGDVAVVEPRWPEIVVSQSAASFICEFDSYHPNVTI